MFKVKATIVSTRSSEILKLLQSKLVWWYIITRQGKTQWKDFLAFTQGVRQRIWLGGLWTRLLPLLALPISKAGVIMFQSRKCGKSIAFVMNILVYKVFWSMVQVCYSYILLYLWWCPHNMWDRLLIKCDWFINFRKQETNIPLTCIFIYIYMVQTKLVQYIPPPPPPNYFGEKSKRNV